ncbi:MAG: hypothetical protein ABSF32_11600 [Ignavibacteria bacterium]|jgi:hypothetical protein
MNKNKLLLIFILLLTTGIYFSGCGKKDATSSGDKKEDVKPEEQKQTTEGTKTNELGITEGLPKDYPSDVPEPKNSKCMGSLNTSEGTVVTFESTDKPKDILADFTSALDKNGYKKGEGEMMSDEGGLSMWTKDKKEVSLMLAWDKDKNKSSVVVTYK